jgi:hypothetical protein
MIRTYKILIAIKYLWYKENTDSIKKKDLCKKKTQKILY